MRAVDIGDLDRAVAVQIGGTERGKPADAAADERRRGDQAVGVRRPPGARPGAGRFRRRSPRARRRRPDRRGAARCPRTRGSRAAIRRRARGRRPASASSAPVLDRVAQDAVGIARGGVGVARRDDDLRRGRQRSRPRPATGTDASSARRARPRHGRARQSPRPVRHQICFSGICTTRPSSASVTFSWQVRRDRSGFGLIGEIEHVLFHRLLGGQLADPVGIAHRHGRSNRRRRRRNRPRCPGMLLSRAPSITVRPLATSTTCSVPLCSI